MLLACDVGGTKTLLGVFDETAGRPRELSVRAYQTSAFPGFAALLDAFAADIGPLRVEAAVAGVAGPVAHQRATVTNIGWEVSAADMGRQLGTARVKVLNDLEAMAIGVTALEPSEVVTLQPGVADPTGNLAVIAAGTGLGVACLHRLNGELSAIPTETGHSDFAARTDAELVLVATLRRRFGRATIEHVLSGQGFVHLYRLTHGDRPCGVVGDLDDPAAPALVSQAGLAKRCSSCAEALALFVDAYGAEAGNLALRALATGGVYVGGGIAPKILPALQDGRFVRAFVDKAPMDHILRAVPLHVIVNERAGLLGAAVAARQLLRS